MKKILVTLQMEEQLKRRIVEAARPYGYDVVFASGEEAVAAAAGAEILYGPALEPLRAAKEAKWYCCSNAGVNNVLAEGVLPSDDILVSNSAGAYGVTIAGHIIMVLLMMMRRFADYSQVMETENWAVNYEMGSIMGSRITLLGTGDIGTNTAKRLRAFEPYSITGVNRTGKVREEVYDRVLPMEKLDDVLPETDILIMSLPDTPLTKNALSAKRLDLLKRGAWIVNVGRGSSVDEDALASTLNSGRIAGAALDVMKTEPLPLSCPLRGAKNILLTPHCAGRMNMFYTREKSVEMFCEDLKNYCEGQPMLHLIDKTLGY